MGYDWWDAEREEGEMRYIESILRDHSDTIITGFVEGRLASYFEDHPDLAAPAIGALKEAKSLLDASPSASLVFAMTSVELAVQDLFLKPVVAGLCHHPDVGELLAQLVDIRTKKTERALFSILEHLDLPSFGARTLPGGPNVWEERDALRDIRNRVVHRGEMATGKDATRAVALAVYFLGTLFPELVAHFTHRSSGYV